MLTAKKVTCVKTPPGFVENVRFGYVTTGMYMETASYSGIKGCNLNSEMLLSCYLFTLFTSFYTRLQLYIITRFFS